MISPKDGPWGVTGEFTSYTTSLPSGASIALLLPTAPSGGPQAPTTLHGPTSSVWSYPVGPLQSGILAGLDSSDPHCDHASSVSTLPGSYITVASALAILAKGETLTTQIHPPQSSGTPNGWLNNVIMTTYTGPTTVSFTTVSALFPGVLANDACFTSLCPGAICGGSCGHCRVFAPTVYVYYWPVAEPNTACLSTTGQTSTMTAAITSLQSAVSGRGLAVKARGLSGVSGGGGTLVNSNGFTL